MAIANNVTQAASTRLDHVGLTLGNLFRLYSDSRLDAEIRNKIHESLERRWKAADQDLFILAIFLNPYIRSRPFSTQALSHADLEDMAERTYKRLFQVSVNFQFTSEFADYFYEHGFYTPERMKLVHLRAKFEEEVSKVSI